LFTRASAVAVVVCAAAGAIAVAPASARMYVSTSSYVDAAGNADGYVEGYAYVSSAPNTDTLRLDVVRGGATVATATAQTYVAIEKLVPRPTDQIVLTDLTTSESRTTTYTGRLAFDTNVCGTPSTFSGSRDEGATVSVSANVYYGAYDARNDYVSPATIFGAGTRFSGSFGRTLAPNWDMTASQARAIDPSFTVFDDVTRPVGICPAPTRAPNPMPSPPPVAVPSARPVDKLPPTATLVDALILTRPTSAYRALMAGTFGLVVTMNEPGVVRQTLYLDDGAKLPKAGAAAAAKKKAAKKPTVLATGRTVVAKAGNVKVKLKLSKKGRSRLKHGSRTVKLALVTVVTDKAGNARVLPVKRFTVKRTKGTR
jgi:hypothetical protein